MTPLLAVASVAVAGVSWGLVEAHAYTVRHVTVPVLPRGSGPLRILHVSDIHLTPRQRRKVDWLASLAALEVDAVINTGDNLAHPEAVPVLIEALGPLLTLPGAYVHGSNDYFAPQPKNPFAYFGGPSRVGREPRSLPTADLTAAFDSAGWLDLNNRRVSAAWGGVEVDLVGMDDPHLERDHMPAAADSSGVRIGVVHAPYGRVLDELRNDGAQLIFAGHTHGGQVCMPGWGALVTNCDLPLRKAKGLSGWPGPRPDRPGGAGSCWLHVSAGIGTSPYAPVRFACRPEATVVELVQRES